MKDHGGVLVQNSSSDNENEKDNTREQNKFKTPKPKQPNSWTTFLSTNFASVKRDMPPGSTHKEVMANLKIMYHSARPTRTRDDESNDTHEPLPPPVTPVVTARARNEPIPREPSENRTSSADIEDEIENILARSFACSTTIV